MINSMTGFGRSEVTDTDKKISVEIKAVNHRYCDMNIKLPKRLNPYESEIRNILKNYIQRGKVDVYITYESYSAADVAVRYNKDIAAKYMSYFAEMSEDFNIPLDITASKLGRCPDVMTIGEEAEDAEEIWEELKPVLEDAASSFVVSRSKEGENLKNDLLLKLGELNSMVSVIDDISPKIIADYKEKLVLKVNEMLENSQIDDERIAMEATLFADKICVDEEIVRLQSHINQTKDIMNDGGAVGRKLDFIIQEMNREANTILSKAGSVQISDVGINLKTCIEKIREQVQNIE